ncbi:MAG TPA: hypothetical protein VE379_00220 [Vicinamibacterales bacterium]|jgi:hypothetical protein|nr:hypothetical protein [Vicinamibacterales bacterium]
MTDDTLAGDWASVPVPLDRKRLREVADAVVSSDRVARARERRHRALSSLGLVLLCPALFWCAAYGIAPLVRAGFALMAAGTAVLIFAEWRYSSWSRGTLPGGGDIRAHLWANASLLREQARLMKTAPLWCAPVFIGAVFLAVWIHQERSEPQSWALTTAVAAAWVTGSAACRSQGQRLEQRRRELEQLLIQLLQ